MEKWFIMNKKPKEDIDPNILGVNPLVFKILCNRELGTLEEMKRFLNPDLSFLPSPILMKDMVKVGNIISTAIAKKNKIRIIGDYDVDGVMSTAILYRGLKDIGGRVDYRIPHRTEEGYGIQLQHVKEAKEDGILLIITCDNGIAAFEAVEEAKRLGISLVVTDHHDTVKEGEEVKLPIADGIINPKQPGDSYPFHGLCGAAVAYKVMEYLYTLQGRQEECLERYLPFVTLATVCDVMPLVEENRIYVTAGLPAIQRTGNPGFQALLKAKNLIGKELTVYHLGFVLGPMINSIGRLDDATEGVELFVTNSQQRADEIAQRMLILNERRQEMTENGLEKLEKQLEGKDLPEILILYEDSIHESLAGIIAGRLKERYFRPTIVFTRGKKSLKGSGRSIEGYSIVDEMARYRDYFLSFGGHPMACGISIAEEKFRLFQKKAVEEVSLTEEDLVKKIRLDAPLHLSQINFGLLEDLEGLKPYGTGNPEPLFGTKHCNLLDMELVGKNKNVLKLRLSQGGTVKDAILFKDVKSFFVAINARYPGDVVKRAYYGKPNPITMDIVYKAQINEFMGNKNIQLVLESYRF